MLSRVEKKQKLKDEFTRGYKKVPILTFNIFISLIIYISSITLWFWILKETYYCPLIEQLITINIITISLFLSSALLKFVALILKNYIKLLLACWLVLIVQFSELDPIEQSAWITFPIFIFVYFEVLLEFNDYFQRIAIKQSSKFKLINRKTIKDNSIALAIFCVALINFALSYYIKDFIEIVSIIIN